VFVELLEHLRCIGAHEPGPLVVAATRSEHRHILDGVLGCPVCGAEYPLRDGIARFGAPPAVRPQPPSVEAAMRVAAFLGLTDSGGFVVLSGSWCAHVTELARLVETPLVLVNPPEGAAMEGAAAVLTVAGALPFAPGSARALALDPDAVPMEPSIALVRAGGRVLAPVSTPLMPSLREVARDAADWVAERVGAPALVELKRAR